MDRTTEVPTLSARQPAAPPVGSVWSNMRKRIIAGLLVVSPFLITFWIVYWLYTTLYMYAIGPAAQLVVRLIEGQAAAVVLPVWFTNYFSPIVGVLIIGVLLYFLGFFAHTRLVKMFDGLLMRVPIITPIHKAVTRVFQSIDSAGDFSRFKRAVLVSFPHEGMRAPAFVTSSCRDEATQRTILCVYVPTTPIPTSGYMLLVPEDEVTELEWTMEETLQAVVSFGLTAPAHVRYYREADAVAGIEAVPGGAGRKAASS